MMRSYLTLLAIALFLAPVLAPAPGVPLAGVPYAVAQIADASAASVLVPTVATGTIIGTVFVQGTNIPLAYSVVSIASLNREQFTDALGHFTLSDVPAGKITLRAKHIGFTPLDTSLTVPAGDTVHLRVELAKLAVQLPAVQTVAACTNPGAPRADKDQALFTLFEQLRQNAERSRLLTRSYPFHYTVVRTATKQSNRDPSAPPDTEAIDTLTGTSQREWRYKPGNVVVVQDDANYMNEMLMLPELSDFADDAFIKNHCFGYAGVEQVDGTPLLRIDFAPADKNKEPDIAGIVYLDSATFQIRRAQITLTKPPVHLRRVMLGVTVTTFFKELVPGIPLMAEYTSVTTLPLEQQQEGWATSSIVQQMLGVEWLKGKP